MTHYDTLLLLAGLVLFIVFSAYHAYRNDCGDTWQEADEPERPKDTEDLPLLIKINEMDLTRECWQYHQDKERQTR